MEQIIFFAVKGNQGSLEEEVKTTCKQHKPVFDKCVVEKGHGRIETRRCEVFEKGLIEDEENRWAKLTSVIKNTSIRELPNKPETQERFYISSLATKRISINIFETIGQRKQFALDFLDMTFHEDEQRKSANHAAKNFAIVRKIGLTLLKKDSRTENLYV